MLEIFRLIRIHTIIFAALTMYAMRYFVVLPMLQLNGFTLQMTDWAFALLVIAVCCLISGAYVINDYFDTKTDRISGVKDVLVGKSISRRMAISMHTLFNVIAVGIAFYLGFAVGVWKIGILFLLVSGILWFYSTVYKKYFIVGNVMVGLLGALIPVCAIIYEIPLLNIAYTDILVETDTNFAYMFYWVFGFSWFIFLNILMYEINKDIYTLEGDRENGVNTIPVKCGVQVARMTITILAVLAMISVIAGYYLEFSASLAILVYCVVALLIPYLIYIIVINSKQPERTVSLNLIRLITLLCLGISVLLKYFFQLIFLINSIFYGV